MPHAAVKRKAKKSPRVSVVLTAKEYGELEKIANTSERSMSWLGRYAVRRLLEEYQEKQLPLNLELPKD
jgi:ribbon-helix-helix CopG family protein